MEGLQEDIGGEAAIQYCSDHPYKTNTSGGICAFCLQEKLGKLVSSSFPIAIFPSSSSSSSPNSFRSDFAGAGAVSARPNASSSSSLSATHTINLRNDCHYHYSRRARIPFLLTQKKKKKTDLALTVAGGVPDQGGKIVFRRSMSTATPRRRGVRFMDADNGGDGGYSPRKRGFWSSFLYLSKQSGNRKTDKPCKEICYSSSLSMGSFPVSSRETKRREEFVVVEENESPDEAASGRKVSRSRSVGCGSRSFSGDFFERISTGFGDCTLRRVESQREGKPKVTPVHRSGRGGAAAAAPGKDCIKERVKCGGIFSGFMITSSSSSSSSSSYWVSSSAEDNNMNGKKATAEVAAAAAEAEAARFPQGRRVSWGWALASPIRAFSKPSSGKRESSNKNTTTPNLNAIPSLLAVGG